MLVVLHELSPWSMFLSADILVKAVIVGLVFASLATWTILIGKTVELSSARRKLGAALARVGDVRSLAEAQFALGSENSVLSTLLAAAMREAAIIPGFLFAAIGASGLVVDLLKVLVGRTRPKLLSEAGCGPSLIPPPHVLCGAGRSKSARRRSPRWRWP